MPHHKRRIRFLLALLAAGFFAGAALTANSAQADGGVGPYMPQPAWDRKLPSLSPVLRPVGLEQRGSAG